MSLRRKRDQQAVSAHEPPPAAPVVPRGPRGLAILDTGPVPPCRGALDEALHEVVNSLVWDAGQDHPRASWRALRVAVNPAGDPTLHLSTGGPAERWSCSRHSARLLDLVHGGLAERGYRAGFVLDVTPHSATVTWH